MNNNWNIPKVWENETAYILGGGASIISQFGIPADIVKQVRNGKLPMSVYSSYMEKLFDKNVIGINAAYQLGSWVDYVYFMDKDYMLAERGGLSKFPNKVISALEYSETEDWCYTVKGTQEHGICETPNTIAYNWSSGAAAINLAYHLGAKKIVLLGFDMKLTRGKQHFHQAGNGYTKPKLIDKVFKRHLQAFEYIKNDADRLGVEIINASPKSAIKEFKRATLNSIL